MLHCMHGHIYNACSHALVKVLNNLTGFGMCASSLNIVLFTLMAANTCTSLMERI